MSASSSNFKQVESKIKHDYFTCKDGKDEDDPFDFTFYGAFGVESSKKPSKITIDLKLDTYHGSHTALDTFESDATESIVLRP